MKLVIIVIALSTIAFPGSGQSRFEKNALIVLTNRSTMTSREKKTGYNLTQLVHVVEGLGKGGFGLVFASPMGGMTTPDPASFDPKDTLIQKFLTNATLQEALQNTKAVTEVDVTRIGVIVFIGGHGALWDFVEIPSIATAASALHEVGGIVAAISHGTAVFLQMKKPDGTNFLDFRRVTCALEAEEKTLDTQWEVPIKLEQSIRYSGGVIFDLGPFQKNVVADDRVITAQNAESAEGFAKAIVEKWNLMFPAFEERKYTVQPSQKKKQAPRK